MQIRQLVTEVEFGRYLDFANEVYKDNPHWVPEDRHHTIALIGGRSHEATHCRIQALWAEVDGRIQATVTAVIDDALNHHQGERAGHLVFFEALPDARDETRALLNAACEWLKTKGASFARFSNLYGWQLPLTIDAYDVTPTVFHTYNPPYYHSFIKDAGFVTDRGVVEYRVQFTDELAAGYGRMVESAQATLRNWDFSRLEEESATFTALVNRTFLRHWGYPQFAVEELSLLTMGLRDYLAPGFLVFAEVDGALAGGVLALPDLNQAFKGKSIDHGVLLVIGVEEKYRGKGINLAMAARSYLAMIERGYRSASYTTVLDDNWPSRRTAEKLGAHVERNFVVYRRDLVPQ